MENEKTAFSSGGQSKAIRIAFFTILTSALLFTMWKLIYDGPRIGGIDNMSLFVLLNLNIILLLLMGLIVGRNLVKLSLARHSQVAGAKFQTKLVLSFLGLTLIPSALLFVVASGLITNSIDNWANQTVEKSLRESMEVIQSSYSKEEKSGHVEPGLAEKKDRITRTYKEYEQLKNKRFPIKAMYEITLLLVTLVVLFGSIWFGLYFAKEITVPIKNLMDATQKVAEGDLSVRLEEKSRDEIGVLTRSFNRMTEELGSSRQKLEQSHTELVEMNLELDRRRKYIETILAHIAAGVVSIDGRGRLSTCNPSAVTILSIKDPNPLGKYYEDVLDPTHMEVIRELLREMGKTGKDYIKRETPVFVEGARRTLLIHISSLKDSEETFIGMVAVFEDITAIINAEKTSAWRDIARYMAHEIKNPLTPIRLNAERLRKNHATDKEAFERNFEPCTEIIIQEVEVLRTLVDEFSRFGQLPVASPEMSDLNAIIDGVVKMYDGIRPAVAINTEYDQLMGKLELDKEQMHRVFRNIIENAMDAVGDAGTIEIRTVSDPTNKRAMVEIADNGPGIDPADLGKIFMPYFSTKQKGTGLGLAIVNRIIADHNGHIVVRNRQQGGTAISIDLPA
ncbi:MAG: HAMP domain-containing protein [Nitrospinae bacterium]|nr:HAMP domain-containing protein [Nitrospinota bacterium]